MNGVNHEQPERLTACEAFEYYVDVLQPNSLEACRALRNWRLRFSRMPGDFQRLALLVNVCLEGHDRYDEITGEIVDPDYVIRVEDWLYRLSG